MGGVGPARRICSNAGAPHQRRVSGPGCISHELCHHLLSLPPSRHRSAQGFKERDGQNDDVNNKDVGEKKTLFIRVDQLLSGKNNIVKNALSAWAKDCESSTGFAFFHLCY